MASVHDLRINHRIRSGSREQTLTLSLGRWDVA